MAEIRGNRKLLEPLAEEILRLESPAQGMFRRVTADTTLGGVTLREGEHLSLRFGSANRDESQFPHATRIDLHRPQPGKHLALGIGRHHCIGAALARQELITAFGALLDRLDDFSLTPGTPASRVRAELLRPQPARAARQLQFQSLSRCGAPRTPAVDLIASRLRACGVPCMRAARNPGHARTALRGRFLDPGAGVDAGVRRRHGRHFGWGDREVGWLASADMTGSAIASLCTIPIIGRMRWRLAACVAIAVMITGNLLSMFAPRPSPR